MTTEYLWCGRSVKVIDGSSVSMPDTVINLARKDRAGQQSLTRPTITTSREDKKTCPVFNCRLNKNQEAYPQPKSQKLGCGFPIAKISVIFSLATGAAIALAIDVLNNHDLTLARKLYEFLKPNDILLGDRAS